MTTHIRASHPIYSLLPTEIEGFDSLAELALNMRWSWNHATDELWHPGILYPRRERHSNRQYYLPAATAYDVRSANAGEIGRRIVNGRHLLRINP